MKLIKANLAFKPKENQLDITLIPLLNNNSKFAFAVVICDQKEETLWPGSDNKKSISLLGTPSLSLSVKTYPFNPLTLLQTEELSSRPNSAKTGTHTVMTSNKPRSSPHPSFKHWKPKSSRWTKTTKSSCSTTKMWHSSKKHSLTWLLL